MRCFSRMLMSNVRKRIIVMNSLDTRFSRNVFEGVKKTRSTCFIGSKTTCSFFKHYMTLVTDQSHQESVCSPDNFFFFFGLVTRKHKDNNYSFPNGAYARDVIAAMLVYHQQKSWFVMVNQHGHPAIVIGIPWDWLHTLYTFSRIIIKLHKR